jgi:hypothetical protein
MNALRWQHFMALPPFTKRAERFVEQLSSIVPEGELTVEKGTVEDNCSTQESAIPLISVDN